MSGPDARHGASPGRLPPELAPGSVWLLTTRTRDSRLRTRPVTIVATTPERIIVVTGLDAEKLDQLRHDPAVSMAGPAPGGWLAAEGEATVHTAPDQVEALVASSPLALPGYGLAAIEIRLDRARRWEVRSHDPWDNICHEIPVPD